MFHLNVALLRECFPLIGFESLGMPPLERLPLEIVKQELSTINADGLNCHCAAPVRGSDLHLRGNIRP